jgi:hypothetical protein
MGATLLRNRLLSAQGWRVVGVVLWEWDEDNEAAQEVLLVQKLGLAATQ